MMNSFTIKSNVPKARSAAVASLFTGETESVREKLQRQQIVNDLNYGFESATAEIDPEEEALGDIYDIDSFLEKKEEQKKKEEEIKEAQQKKKEKKPSKYIAILKQRAEERKREMDIVYEKNKIKEREKEDALYEGKEKFITSAYKRKLEADRKYLDDIRKREEQNKNNKSTFLTNLLNARTYEPKPIESSIKEPRASQVEEHKDENEKEDEDEFEGFIMAPPEDQIKGNVSSDDAGFIMEPKENTHSHSRHRSRSRSRSRHRHHHRHHHHCYI